MERLFSIGKIVNTQGVRGEVRVIPTTDDIKRFEILTDVIVLKKDVFINLLIENVRYHKNFVILKFKNIDTMTKAEELKNSVIKIPESLALPLEDDEYYIIDLIDLEVYTEDNEFLGNIKDVFKTGANDVYVVKKDDIKDLLIPAIKQCILKVDIENNKMTVRLLEGLR